MGNQWKWIYVILKYFILIIEWQEWSGKHFTGEGSPYWHQTTDDTFSQKVHVG